MCVQDEYIKQHICLIAHWQKCLCLFLEDPSDAFFFLTCLLIFFFLGTSLRRVISWRSELLDLLPPSPTLCRGAQRASSTGKTKFSWTSLSQLIYWWGHFSLVHVIAFPSNGGVEIIQTPLKKNVNNFYFLTVINDYDIFCVFLLREVVWKKDEYNEMCMEKNPLNKGFSENFQSATFWRLWYIAGMHCFIPHLTLMDI